MRFKAWAGFEPNTYFDYYFHELNECLIEQQVSGAAEYLWRQVRICGLRLDNKKPDRQLRSDRAAQD